MENEINDKKVMAAEKVFTAKQLLEVKNKLSKLGNDLKEKDDNAMILECTLKNRDIEIKRLKTELEEVKIFKCDTCDYSAARESELKTHMKTIHEVICSHCNCTCAGENKFRNHICKVHV